MLEELINNLLNIEENNKEEGSYTPLNQTRRERRQTKRFHPEDTQNLYNIFNRNCRSIASNKLKKYGYEATEKEINVLIFVWFNEYMNEGGTFLDVPFALRK